MKNPAKRPTHKSFLSYHIRAIKKTTFESTEKDGNLKRWKRLIFTGCNDFFLPGAFIKYLHTHPTDKYMKFRFYGTILLPEGTERKRDSKLVLLGSLDFTDCVLL